tara:strand:+ start:1055 stop:1564 length:510 start_codon:yes stop_codon:yes gene_type:complete
MSDNPNLKKNGGKGTKTGNFLRGILGAAPKLIDLVTGGKFTDAISMISGDPKNAGLSESQANQVFELIQLDIQDIQHSRNMQVAIATSKESTNLAKNFIYYLSIGVFSFAVLVVILLFFKEIPDKNRDVVNFILGVLIGTGLTGIFNYFFGSSKGSKDKADLLSVLNNK